MKTDQLKTLRKEDIPELAKKLTSQEVDFLIPILAEKDDTLRYPAFLLLKEHSQYQPNVYQHWDTLEKKLTDMNSFQRNIGLWLIAENVRWDKNQKFRQAIDAYLDCTTDEKFITARQAIQGLTTILQATSQYDDKIKQALSNLKLDKYKQSSQQPLLKKDIANALKTIQTRQAPAAKP